MATVLETGEEQEEAAGGGRRDIRRRDDKEIDEKEIQDKIRETQAKLAGAVAAEKFESKISP